MSVARSLALAGFVAAAACLPPPPASAVPIGWRMGFEERSWDVQAPAGTTTLRQRAVPVVITVRPSSGVDVVVAGGGASSTVSSSTTRAGLDAMRSVSARVFWRSMDDRLMVLAGVALPSGKVDLNFEEFTVARLIDYPVLGFAQRNQAGGLEGSAGATWAQPLSSIVTVALGAVGVARGPYDLIEFSPRFRPASEWAATVGVDLGPRDEGGRAPGGIDVTWRAFGEDRLGPDPSFAEGDQLELDARVRLGGEGLNAHASGRLVWKERSRVLAPPGYTVGDFKLSSGDGQRVAGGVGLPFAARFRVGVEAEHVRVLHADEFGRNGSASAIGPLLAARVGGGFEVVARGQYLWGRFDPIFGLPAYDLEGHALGIGVRWDGE